MPFFDPFEIWKLQFYRNAIKVEIGSSVTLPETNSEFTPENGWLGDKPFLLGRSIFRGELLVSGRVPLWYTKKSSK